jgi:exonuclease SbcC
MKLLEVKLKTNKKTPYVAIKVKYYRFVFVSEETIDFEELTNAGLFGFLEQLVLENLLFEAIGFVFYTVMERLNKTDKRSYNMLNLKSDKANIEFEFLNFEERKFKFVEAEKVLKKPHQ